MSYGRSRHFLYVYICCMYICFGILPFFATSRQGEGRLPRPAVRQAVSGSSRFERQSNAKEAALEEIDTAFRGDGNFAVKFSGSWEHRKNNARRKHGVQVDMDTAWGSDNEDSGTDLACADDEVPFAGHTDIGLPGCWTGSSGQMRVFAQNGRNAFTCIMDTIRMLE